MNHFDEHYSRRKAQTEERAEQLAQALLKAGRQEDLFRAAENAKLREELYKEFHIDG